MTYILQAGDETQVSVGHDQNGVETITRLANGNFVISWNAGDLVPDAPSGWYWADVYTQMYDAEGNKIGDQHVANTITNEDQAASQIIATADGGYIVVWEYDQYDLTTIPTGEFLTVDQSIHAQRFDAWGNALAFSPTSPDGGEVTLSSATINYLPATARLSDGSMVIGWLTQTATGQDVVTQHYAADGTLLGTTSATANNQNGLKLTALNDGTYLMTYADFVPGSSVSYDVYTRHFDAAGTAIGAAVRVNTYLTNQQIGVATTVLSDGGYVVTWQSRLQDGALNGVYGQTFDASGKATGSEFRVNTYTDNNQASAVVQALDDGSFAVAWVSTLQDGSSGGVYFQHFAADGSHIGDEIRVADETVGNQTRPHMEAIDGGVVVTWSGVDADNHLNVYARTFTAAGIEGDEFNNTVTGTASADVLYGYEGNDTLNGAGENDVLIAGSGDDLLNGGQGADTMYGGTGNDTYVVDNPGDKIVERLDSGLADTVAAAFSYTLGDNLEILALVANFNINGTGNGADNILVGNAGNNQLSGVGGNDILLGGLGVDTLIGGDGNDTLSDHEGDSSTNRDILNGGNGNDQFDADAYDRVDGGDGIDTATIDFTSYYNVTHLGISVNLANANNGGQVNFVTGGWIVGVEATTLTATGANDAVSDGNWNGRVAGGAGDDRLLGNAGDDVLMGGDNNDSVDGGDGYDWLFGGAGNDVIRGGAGNDHIGDIDGYIRGGATPPGPVTSVQVADPFVLLAYEDQNDFGADTVAGEAGDDVIFGWGGNDRLDGGTGGDILIGGTGNDSLIGGDGNDVYYVDTAGDVITEAANGGYDQVYSTVSFALSPTQEIEALTLLSDDNIDATGNAQVNFLVGNNGNNVLDGRAGADAMSGMGGNDTYIVDNLGERVSEWGVNGDAGGDDLVKASVSFQLADFVERLTLTGTGDLSGTGNALDNTLIGTRGANWLDGGAGADTMTGGVGDDTYIVDDAKDMVVDGAGQGNDRVISSVSFDVGAQYIETVWLTGETDINVMGNGIANLLIGNAGNNKLDGGLGSDTLSGGLGNDSYYIDSYGDVVVEEANAGTDTVYTSLRLTLGAYVENLVLLGSDNQAGAGNALNNWLVGNSGANNLSGLDGDDVIDGGAGSDNMAGGTGNDTYYVDNASDRVVEAKDQGSDAVFASVSFSTGSQYIENVALTGSAALSLTGNSLAETLTGNDGANIISAGAGSDWINGGLGNDSLTGGTGADHFIFGLASGNDVVTDFSAAQGDVLDLHAYSNGVTLGGGITLTQVGTATVIDLGGGNTVTLNNTVATSPALLSHIVW